MWVHLNGEIVPLEQARISPEDRAFLFADGLYEAVLARRGKLLFWDEHERRMRNGLAALRIEGVDAAALRQAAAELLARNELLGGDALVYLQVSRGAAPRLHAFPDPPVRPTTYVAVRALAAQPDSLVTAGAAAVTVADTRWARCDIKSTGLLANVLAQQSAREAGAHEAIFVRDGVALEGSHSNLFVIRRGELSTYPACNYILEGVTRGHVLRLAGELGIATRLGGVTTRELIDADEVFMSGTTTHVLPVTRIDGRAVGEGTPGPITQRLRAAYAELVDERSG